jgi:hypothetical protein
MATTVEDLHGDQGLHGDGAFKFGVEVVIKSSQRQR